MATALAASAAALRLKLISRPNRLKLNPPPEGWEVLAEAEAAAAAAEEEEAAAAAWAAAVEVVVVSGGCLGAVRGAGGVGGG